MQRYEDSWRWAVAAAIGAALILAAAGAWASGGECTGFCGTPNQSGGGGAPCVDGVCSGGGGSILVNNTDYGDTYQYSDDFDTDGFEDDYDNCPFVSNVSQLDTDGDGLGDLCDVCIRAKDPMQLDTDGDSEGDACDEDRDNDGILNRADNCPLVSNPMQLNTDADELGDACDGDDDDDGVLDVKDNCPLVANPQQLNTDPNRFGDACDADGDLDNVPDSKDNCPAVANLDQEDIDGDGLGDLCDGDIDGDGVANPQDNCRETANPLQRNADRDDLGDECDPKFCYVVRRSDDTFDERACLDPSTTFTVFSPDEAAPTGEPLRLRLFANRQQRAIEYTWTVVERPAGSAATVKHPRGMVNASSTYEYFYLRGNVARFVADAPGTYKLRLDASLVFPDTANPAWPTESTYVMTLTADGESAAGCSVGGRGDQSAGWMLLGLGVLVALRRRRR